MFESDMASHIALTHQNDDKIHPEAFMPTRKFLEWLDEISSNKIVLD